MGLHIFDRYSLAKYSFIDGFAETTVQRATFIERYANHTADELEEHQMLVVDFAQLVGVKCDRIRCNRNEESVVRIEHLSREDAEPFSSRVFSIHSFLTSETDAELAVFDLIVRLERQIFIRVEKNMITSDS